jgi:hypothetical protein
MYEAEVFQMVRDQKGGGLSVEINVKVPYEDWRVSKEVS